MKKRIPILVVIVLAALVPLVVKSPYYMHILILAMMYIMLTEGLNLLTGYLGFLSLGHIAFMGLGAYTSALLSLNFGISPLLCMPVAGLASAAFSYLIGKITFRVRGAYFVIMTSAYCEITKLVINNSTEVTNGPMGLRGVPSPVIFGFTIHGKVPYYYFGLVLVIITVYVCSRFANSRTGRACIALREEEKIASAIGIDFNRYAMMAAVIGGFFAGIAGSYYVHYTNFISPDIFGWSYTTTILLMLVIGGKGTISGPIVGSLVFSFIPELLRKYDDFRLPIYGVLLMVAVLFMTNGIVSVCKNAFTALKAKTHSFDSKAKGGK